jgi:hypothetical protein
MSEFPPLGQPPDESSDQALFSAFMNLSALAPGNNSAALASIEKAGRPARGLDVSLSSNCETNPFFRRECFWYLRLTSKKHSGPSAISSGRLNRTERPLGTGVCRPFRKPAGNAIAVNLMAEAFYETNPICRMKDLDGIGVASDHDLVP